MNVFDEVDPKLTHALRAAWLKREHEPIDGIPRGVTVVLAGHRAAGKSRLLPLITKTLGRPGFDLDEVLAKQRPLHQWVTDDLPSFRAAERVAFEQLPRGCVVSVGGGFLATHASALVGCIVVLVPVTYETYVERLRTDTSRPRLRPGVPIEAELREVFREREELHRLAHPMPLVDFVLRMNRGLRARRVVTAPPDIDVEAFAWRARHRGADVLELRTDFTPLTLDLRLIARALPLLVAERGAPVPSAWAEHAELSDVDLRTGSPSANVNVMSFHSPTAMTTEQALTSWAEAPSGAQIKHVEPLGELARLPQLLETQAALVERFGSERVTVLATGAQALPARAVLAARNALDYLALDATWAAAPGQRTLVDAVRESRHSKAIDRLAILGAAIAHSRSPRIHTQPFDRIELSADTEMGPLLKALHRTHRGFAVTNPFKKRVALAVGASEAAVNTLVRTPTGWLAANTDHDGAAAVLRALGAKQVTVLGDGGATEALRVAAQQIGVTLMLHPHKDPFDAPLTGAVVWTWPAHVEAPAALRFADARVAVIAYGPAGREIARRIRALGGKPAMLGPRWFVAQARRQRALWEQAQ